jgi:cellulose synthase/poly-beta-1,6-N-acetylglucosamine synthase-like glycosyltransferase
MAATGSLTLIFSVLSALDLYRFAAAALEARDFVRCVELVAIYIFAILLLYGCITYHLGDYGQVTRQRKHRRAPRSAIEAVYDRESAEILVLVPSYREDEIVIRQTLVSAALAEYPGRTVVLLIDDPPNPTTPEDAATLMAARRLPRELQALFQEPADRFKLELDHFETRARQGTIDAEAEASRLASICDEIAAWLEDQVTKPHYCRVHSAPDHTDRLFLDRILLAPASSHRSRAAALRGHSSALTAAEIGREYRRLAAVFRVRFESFERKRYANLSHTSNKAMNLNSYIALIGGAFHEVQRDDGLHLEPCTHDEATLLVPRRDYLVVLDADTLVLADYMLRLGDIMERPENRRLAVTQTPYAAFAGASGLERLAGASTDVQTFAHWGMTYFDAVSWVGSNALIRLAALEDIVTHRQERGHTVRVYVQDKTLTEDTESSVELILKGWRLHSHPEHLAFSATPSDFGALEIQRRRWATGGLIVVPRLLRYACTGRLRASKLGEVLLRLYNMTSTSIISAAWLTLFLPGYDDTLVSIWLPLAASPYQVLYGFDLKRAGYRWRDLPKIYSLNLMLLPVNLSGTVQTIRQMVTGRKAPFRRTPKVAGRTAVSASCLLGQYAILLMSLFGVGYDIVAQQYYHLVFSAVNSAAFLYGISRFVGWRNSVEDLTASLVRWRSASGRLDATAAWPRLRDAPPTAPGTPIMASAAEPAEGR